MFTDITMHWMSVNPKTNDVESLKQRVANEYEREDTTIEDGRTEHAGMVSVAFCQMTEYPE